MLTPRCTLLQHQTGRLPRTPKIPCLQQRRVTHKCHSNKQYVPSDGFGGMCCVSVCCNNTDQLSLCLDVLPTRYSCFGVAIHDSNGYNNVLAYYASPPGLSPERKAADQLRTLFTYIAARCEGVTRLATVHN